ncbi:MAG: mechanosensitive ion channel family protein [Candidatus Harrisonbacteria bacterium CG10_big_fil_rev_8_21_14_0_10_44_23]|uniref:Mechanosensitive ion channel family protein n=1 Tax=Candidatus Harrisonbacteria bacterium CG10_big_fil_rev_8_21_14_0_10_44_23 TaxID=1974585 RepID=A0A2H0UQG2_9BACT|nr:MAG: mechanosensitive ion channel family protein [Candidatus Harrisonbacteria bacterium CG10_big_fil_rev_8_21_14_0_10_44_23]
MDFNSILQSISDGLARWFVDHSVAILGIIVAAIILRWVAKWVIEKMVRTLVRENKNLSARAEEKRENTLISVFRGTASLVIFLLAILMILSESGLDIGPLIATAGIIGLAVGFGGQYLIKDLLAGLFILLENQYRVGDVIEVAGVSGVVEGLNLRITMLRDLDGTLHYVPNGEIKTASNKSMGFARVNMNVGVGYGDDLEKVKKVINAVGDDLTQDPEWKDKILKAPQFVRVENFGDSSVDVKILGDVQPLEQWAVAGEFRKRLKEAFDKEGIEIPFPQRVIHKAE